MIRDHIKNALLGTVASTALASALATSANADTAEFTLQGHHSASSGSEAGPILPRYGDIDPFYGDINPFWGDINPFYGDIGPFWGDIDPFWGDINPFYGDIDAFWGDIDAFYGDIDPFYGDIDAFWGDIGAFWGDIGPFWGDIDAFWGDIDPFDTEAYSTLTGDLNELFNRAETVFGPAIEGETGRSFQEGFLNDLTAEYGINMSDPASLASVTAQQRAAFFLAFHDGLMNFSGRDHVDHWMGAINWSPAMAREASTRFPVVVGIVDFSLPSRIDGLIGGGNGNDYLDFNHGAAVADLISARHDGEGLMGVAPSVRLRLENPFDETLSTNWDDVRSSVRRLSYHSAIINASLGMPGWTFHEGWSDVLSDWYIRHSAPHTLYVFAAGNDGITQDLDVDWSAVRNVENLLIVGSINPGGEISSFSNRPGDACFTVRGACHEGSRLMDRFLVAPGELILVPDGEGGYVRMSGTSFAAPLVTGAAALVKSEWLWLSPGRIADVILETATDLGAPGVDPVYGRGLLNVQAALSPIDQNALYALDWRGRRIPAGELGFLRGRIKDHGEVTVFEDIGDTFRDFSFTLEELGVGQDALSGSAQITAQSYSIDRAINASGTNFNDTQAITRRIQTRNGLTVTSFASQADMGQVLGDGDLPFQAGMEVSNSESGVTIRFGMGEGALALSDQSGFGLASDYRPDSGGVNPMLGYASGGAYAMAGFALSPDTNLSIVATSTRDEYEFTNPLTGERSAIFETLDAYSASAVSLDLSHAVNSRFGIQAAYTHLAEDQALLGGQGLGALAFDGGSRTDALTVGANVAISARSSVSVSATAGITGASEFGASALALPDSVSSTAFQISFQHNGVFTARDGIRASFIQPLHVENGSLEYSGLVVTDRDTGTLGLRTQQWSLGGERPLAAEVLYAIELVQDRVELNAFGRTEAPGARFADGDTSWAGGFRLGVNF